MLASTLRSTEPRWFSRSSRARIRSLQIIRHALRKGALDQALREVDRAWRNARDDAEELAPVYGRMLSLEGRDHEAALRMLQRVATPDPDIAALKAHALLHLRRGAEARLELEAALTTYCVEPGLLAHVAAESFSDPDIHVPGWLGLGPTLEITGELRFDEPVDSLTVRLGGQAEFALSVPKAQNRSSRAFHFKIPPLPPGASVEMCSRGMPLLGSGLCIPLDFGLDSRAASNGRQIVGWVTMGWAPQQPVRLGVEDETGHRRLASTGDSALPGYRWPFRIDLSRLNLQGNRIRITALMPDGRWQSLPDSPLLLAQAVRLPGSALPSLPGWKSDSSVGRSRRASPMFPVLPGAICIDIIIPVYRGRPETLACIDSALATTDKVASIVVIDDATDDAVLAGELDELAARGRITLLRNEANLGFVASVNRAMALHPTHDAVLLNSDAQVFGDWLPRLRAAAYREPKIGTVTPFSNAGSIATYPDVERALTPEEVAALHALAASTHDAVSVGIPVGVGFCLYVRRDCLHEVGEFDATVFGKGYGEETDFCLRARRRGWSHRLAADVFVYHAGGRSFAGRRAALLHRSQRLLNLRHPGYDRFIASFLRQDPLHALRRRLDEQRLAAFDGRFVLLVTLALDGGVKRFVDERRRAIRASGLFPLVLKPAVAGDSRRCEILTDAIDVPNLRYEIPQELAALTTLLRTLRIDSVEIQHFLHLDARVIDAVRTLQAPYDVYIHDYAWICPRVTLIDGSGRYCGEPAVSVCESCVRRHGSRLDERISVPALRSRSDTWLHQARHVITPSADTASRLRRYFPDRDIQVRSHTAPLAPAQPWSPATGRQGIVRVAVIGAIGGHKGYQVLLRCARDARSRRLRLEFVVIGHTENDGALLRTGKVFITGRYAEGEAAHLLRRERADIAFFPSVWPETWCYTLDEALAIGLPVVAFDLGAIAERLSASGTGVLLPLDCEPSHINDCIMQSAVKTVLSNSPDADMMSLSRENKMDKPAAGDSLQQAALSASVQILPLPVGLYLFSVKAAPQAAKNSNGQLRLPAMHVGLGPGVNSEQVEFVAGPSTEGAWLFAKEDLLVTKIKGAGATLILTSVRAPGGEVLSIKIERLEDRIESPALPVAPARPAIEADRNPSSVKSKAVKGRAKTDAKPMPAPESNAMSDESPPLQVTAHIRSRGDMAFTDSPWAGRVAPGLWIESFSIKPLHQFTASDVEYKGLTGSGFETPWLSDDQMCGTKGMSVPLVGFAVRLKPSPKALCYDCEYSAYFKSGLTIGPMRNGAPCRSTVANDPLEGIQVRITKRMAAAMPASAPKVVSPSAMSLKPVNGPSFGRYREEHVNGRDKTNGEALAKKASATPTPAEPPRTTASRVSTRGGATPAPAKAGHRTALRSSARRS